MALQALPAEPRFRCGAAGEVTVTPENLEWGYASWVLGENGDGIAAAAFKLCGVPPNEPTLPIRLVVKPTRARAANGDHSGRSFHWRLFYRWLRQVGALVFLILVFFLFVITCAEASTFNVVGPEESCAPRGPSRILIFDDASDFKDAVGHAPAKIKLGIDICKKRPRLAGFQLRAFKGAALQSLFCPRLYT
jgi:hypothetical protein